MATVRLSDAVIPAVYDSYTAVDTPERTAFWQSGVIAQNPILSGLAQQGGTTGTVPFWQDLDATGEPDYSNDDPADLSTPGKLGSGTMNYRKAYVNKSWSAMDLVAELTGSNPMQRIKNRFGVWWMRQLQHRLIALVIGLYNNNASATDANHTQNDMIVDISGLAGAASLMQSTAAVDAQYTMGDAVGKFNAIAMHSAVAQNLEKADLIDNVPDSQQGDEGGTISIYRKMRVIIDDALTLGGGNYLSVLFGGGAIGFGGAEGTMLGYGEGSPEVPSEVIRVPAAGHGGGMETIFERKTWLLHPFGYQWVEAGGGALAQFSATLADLKVAAKWARVVTRKQTPMAFIVSKG